MTAVIEERDTELIDIVYGNLNAGSEGRHPESYKELLPFLAVPQGEASRLPKP